MPYGTHLKFILSSCEFIDVPKFGLESFLTVKILKLASEKLFSEFRTETTRPRSKRLLLFEKTFSVLGTETHIGHPYIAACV